MSESFYVSYLIEKVMYFMAFKMKFVPAPPVVDESVLSLEVVDSMCKTVWVERRVCKYDTSKFLRDHRRRMSSRMNCFIVFALYLCHLNKKCFTDPYELFIRTMTLVFSLPRDSRPTRYLEAVSVCATIFAHYYDLEIHTDFNARGGFENFQTYLLQRDTPRQYSELERLEEAREPEIEIIKQLKLQPTLLKQLLDKGFKELDIITHGPSVSLTRLVLRSGTGGIKGMVEAGKKIHTMHKNATSRDEESQEKNSQAVGDSENPSNSESSRSLINQPKEKILNTKLAFDQARKSVREFHAKCKKLEQLLDFIFEEKK